MAVSRTAVHMANDEKKLSGLRFPVEPASSLLSRGGLTCGHSHRSTVALGLSRPSLPGLPLCNPKYRGPQEDPDLFITDDFVAVTDRDVSLCMTCAGRKRTRDHLFVCYSPLGPGLYQGRKSACRCFKNAIGTVVRLHNCFEFPRHRTRYLWRVA